MKTTAHLLLGALLSLIFLALGGAFSYQALSIVRLRANLPILGVVTERSHLSKVHYQYWVDGHSYSNTSFIDRRAVPDTHPGVTVLVHAAATQPQRATLAQSRDATRPAVMAAMLFLMASLFAALVVWARWRAKQPSSVGISRSLMVFVEVSLLLIILVNIYLAISRTTTIARLEDAQHSGVPVRGTITGTGWQKNSLMCVYVYGGRTNTISQIVSGTTFDTSYIGMPVTLRVNTKHPSIALIEGTAQALIQLKGSAMMNVVYTCILLTLGILFAAGYKMQGAHREHSTT